jgi:nucleoside-diphosphate-sugar epimerase
MDTVGVIGASGPTGSLVLSALAARGVKAVAFSRSQRRDPAREWREIALRTSAQDRIPLWAATISVTALREHFPAMLSYGAKRVVTLSSTSAVTKVASSSQQEVRMVRALLDAENAFIHWAGANGIEWIILRPTMIYGLGLDYNLTRIARLIERFGFFPLLGEARGRRQPVHYEDFAACFVLALTAPTANRIYDVSGGEVLEYREMIRRVFEALGRRPITPHVPAWLYRVVISAVRHLPPFSGLTPEVADRMGTDMVFDNSPARADLGYSPRPFRLTKVDFPHR